MMNAEMPPVVRIVNGSGASRYVLTCEHASRFIPPAYNGLGLDESELVRHIAWDIGAEQVALALSRAIDAPLILAGYSRLLIDLNRPPESASAIPEISELTHIPGNAGLSDHDRQLRVDTYFTPFQSAVSDLLDARAAQGKPSTVIGVHSFTPVFKGFARPWDAGILFRASATFGAALANALKAPGLNIAENEPYQIDDESDYTVPVHGEARGLDAVLVEIRQDLIADDAGASEWARRLAAALQQI